IAAADPATLKEARRLIAEHERAAGYKGGAGWEDQVRCETFVAHVVPFRIGIERAAAEEAGEPLQIIECASLEEIQQDILTVTEAGGWVCLVMCLVAAGLALTPAALFPRPLARITRAAQRLAEGDYDADLPVKATSEIGDLARTFRHMAEQIRHRDLALHD